MIDNSNLQFQTQQIKTAVANYVRQGGHLSPSVQITGDYVGSRFSSSLYPNMGMTIVGQASLPGLVLVQNPTGCDGPTGAELPVMRPYLMAQMTDYLGFPVPFSPGEGDSVEQNLTSQGDPIIAYQKIDPNDPTPKNVPNSNLYAGPAIQILPYGDYPWVGADGTKYPANIDPTTGLATPDKKVNKPLIGLLYNKTHLFVDPKTNELNVLTGENGLYAPGSNIRFLPGEPPIAPVVTMTVGGTMEEGSRRWAISWIVPNVLDPKTGLKADADTDLSPSASGTAEIGQDGESYNSANLDLPARPDPTYKGIKIWRTKVDDDNFYLDQTITDNLDAPQTVTDLFSDSSLGVQHVSQKTRIAVEDWLIQAADLPTSLKTPTGLISLGPWAQRKDLTGYAYEAGNDGAMLFYALDGGTPADLAVAYAKNGSGEVNPKSMYNLTADWSQADPDGHHPLVSERVNGLLRADNGVQGIAIDHSPPVDADIPWPESWGPIKDGLTAICKNNNTSWFRSNGIWHQVTGGGGGGSVNTYVPIWKSVIAGADPDIGNGELLARYQQVGDLVWLHIGLVAGTTTTWGSATDFWTFSPPPGLPVVTGLHGAAMRGFAAVYDKSVGEFYFNLGASIDDSFNVYVYVSEDLHGLRQGDPITFDVGDVITLDLWYSTV